MTNKELILSVLKDCGFSTIEFDKSANEVPSLVSLICRLRKMYINGYKVANKLDQLHSDYIPDFHKATSSFYQL